MINVIKNNNKIFNSDSFQKDKYKFSLILQNLNSENLELYSDEENYILCRGVKNMPTWIWTKDNFDISLLPEIEKAISLYLLDVDTRFTCKRELYEYLVRDNFEYLGDYYFEMGYLTCNETILPKKVDGYIDNVCEDDRDILVNFIYDESREISDIKELSMDEANDQFNKLLKMKSGKYYVWKNDNDEIVAQATYKIADGNAKIGSVYTTPSERGKGYAANLIYTITNELLNSGYHVSLYTDYKYIPSNRAYKNVGYKDNDVLINFSCLSKKQMKRK